MEQVKFSSKTKFYEKNPTCFIASLAEKEKKKKGRPMISDKPLKNLTLRISEEELEKLNKTAQAQKKTKSAIIRDFISSL